MRVPAHVLPEPGQPVLAVDSIDAEENHWLRVIAMLAGCVLAVLALSSQGHGGEAAGSRYVPPPPSVSVLVVNSHQAGAGPTTPAASLAATGSSEPPLTDSRSHSLAPSATRVRLPAAAAELTLLAVFGCGLAGFVPLVRRRWGADMAAPFAGLALELGLGRRAVQRPGHAGALFRIKAERRRLHRLERAHHLAARRLAARLVELETARLEGPSPTMPGPSRSG